MPAHIARGNATRARVRARVEHVFAAQKCRLGLVVRTVGMTRARVKIGLANLAYNFTRLAWLSSRTAHACGNPPQAMVKPNKPMPAHRQSARKSLRPIRLAPQILAQPGSSRCPIGSRFQ